MDMDMYSHIVNRLFTSIKHTSILPNMAKGPDLRKYMDKTVCLRLNAGRRVTGVLRGFDQFMNIVLEQTTEDISPTQRKEIGTVVIRGDACDMIEMVDIRKV